VSEEDIQPFLSRFDEIDADGSGKLTHNDLAAMVKVSSMYS
jgi:Ca2+-binding EF-hand superfamily protein